MNNPWFKKNGWIYLPVNGMGWLVTAAVIVFLIPIYMAVTRHGHSVSDNLYQLFVYTSCAAFWWKWIAEKTS